MRGSYQVEKVTKRCSYTLMRYSYTLNCSFQDKLTGSKRKREQDDDPIPTSEPRSLERIHPHLQLARTEPDDDSYYTFVVGG